MENRHFEADERTQFQVDRIAFFSDAVIAIAITLLILEIKIPPLGAHTRLRDLPAHVSQHTALSLMGMAICFISIGNLWVLHHDLYQHVRNYNKRLVKYNLYFLLTIMLLPLSTSFTMEPDNPPFLTPSIFFLNLGLCYLTYFLMANVIFSPKHHFAVRPDKEKLNSMRRHTLAPAIVFTAASVVAFSGHYGLLYGFLAYPLVAKAWSYWERKKHPAAHPHGHV